MLHSTDDWIRIPRPAPQAKLRLICFPHAGAGASTYYRWSRPCEAARIELAAVQYPGREDRTAQEPLPTMAAMVEELANAWSSIAEDKLCILFGHSLGAAIAFELTLELYRRRHCNLPLHLYVSGRNPPHLKIPRPSISHLPDKEFLRGLLEEYRGVLPEEILEHEELLTLVLRVLRADVGIVEAYAPPERPNLPIPISVLGGFDDPWTTATSLAEWQRYSVHRVKVHMFAGDHFFHQTSWREVVTHVIDRASLSPALV